MRPSNFLAVSCGAKHLTSVKLRVLGSGRFELVDYCINEVELSSSDPLLWLNALSRHLDSVALRFKGDIPTGFTLPSHVALAKYLKIPQVKGNRREKIVAFEARQNIPYPIDEVAWDNCAIAEDELDFEVLIGAAKSEVVESLARYGKESEMRLDCIDPSTTALVNGYRFNYSDVDECSLLISVGAKSTELLYIDKARFYSRSVPFGGQSICDDIAETLGESLADAERIKLDAIAGDQLDVEEQSAFDYACRDFLNRLNAECVRTSALLQRQELNLKPDRCLLTGGGSLLPGIRESLSKRLNLGVEVFDPLRNVSFSNEELKERATEQAALLSDAVGLAVGKFLPDAARLDLRPRSLVWQKKFRRQQPFYLIAGLVACCAVGLPVFNTSLKISTYEQELRNLDIQIRPLSQLNRDIYFKLEEIEHVKDVIEKAGEVVRSRESWMQLLNELQGRLVEVEDVWIDQLELVRPVPPRRTGRGQVRLNTADDQVRLQLAGRLIDVRNPMSAVSPDSYARVKVLLESFRESEMVDSLEGERFDYSVPGILKFDFTLVINPELKL